MWIGVFVDWLNTTRNYDIMLKWTKFTNKIKLTKYKIMRYIPAVLITYLKFNLGCILKQFKYDVVSYVLVPYELHWKVVFPAE